MKRPARTIEDLLGRLVIAIDGPSASGKTTTARSVARELGLRHIDTGAMYRAITLAALDSGIDTSDEAAVAAVAFAASIDLEPLGDGEYVVRLDGRDVSSEIRTPRVTRSVSEVSAYPGVRRAMVRRQREFAARGAVVLEGRDIGSVVLPWADLKVYLDASVPVRAERRQAELAERGTELPLAEVERDIVRRDDFDSGRADSPLQRAVGAWLVDTTGLTVRGQVGEVVRLARLTAERLADLERPRTDGLRPRRRRLVYRASQALLRGIARLVFGLRILHPMDGRLQENYIFAPNHVSNTDPPVIGSTLPRESHFVAKATLFRFPLFGSLIRAYNAYPIRAGIFDREAMGATVRLLEGGESVMIFPEGGRMFDENLGPAKGGVGYLALATGVAVIPIYAAGTNNLIDCLLRRRPMRVAHGRPVRVPPEVAAELRESGDRDAPKRFSVMVMTAVAALRDEVEAPTPVR